MWIHNQQLYENFSSLEVYLALRKISSGNCCTYEDFMGAIQIILLAFCLALSQLQANEVVRQLVQEKQYASLGTFLRDTTLSYDELQYIAEEIHFQPLLDSIQAARKIYAQENNLGIKPNDLLQVALFITTELEAQLPTHTYLTPEMTGLQDVIEFDPTTGYTFIVLDRYKEAYLGKGKKKKVHKAILFDVNTPEIVARAVQKTSMGAELEMLKLLQGAPGLVATRAITTRAYKEKSITTMYFKLYDPGGLSVDFFQKNTFSLYEKASIALSLLTGLESLHSRNLIHRDLHRRNYLIKIPEEPKGMRNVDIVIADFGRTIDIPRAVGLPYQGSSLFCPPEGLLMENPKSDDYFASDIYAVGCMLYRFFHNKIPSWQGEYLRDSKQFSKKSMQRMLIKKLREHTDDRFKTLTRLKSTNKLSDRQQLEHLILRMVQKDPRKRGTATLLRQEAEQIKDRLS